LAAAAPDVEACLLDVYETILHTDFSGYRTVLPELAGITPDAMAAEFRRLLPALSVGELSMTEAFALILRACGTEPRPALARELTDRSRELLLSSARLYDDVLPFLRSLKSRDIKVAIVSNCDENTRPLLVLCGVAALADALVLSCEVGAVKPAAPIFRTALDRLGVTAEAALFVDDTATYCAGAEALGISAVQMVRDDHDGNAAPGTRVVRSLREVEAIIQAGPT
jgi:putative hydrolase of the HAD superfamily